MKLRGVALAVTAAAAVALQLYAGRHSPQHLLLFLIAAWVLSPYGVFIVLDRLARRWPTFPRTALYGLMLFVSAASLAVYVHAAVRPPAVKPAAPFVAVPPAAWLLTAVTLLVAWLISRRPEARH